MFWVGARVEGGNKPLRFFGSGGFAETIVVSEDRYLCGFPFEAANDAILHGRDRFSHPGMDEAGTLGNARGLDDWLASVRP